MKKMTTKKNATKKTIKSMLVKPTMSYTKDEVRTILGLSKGSSLSPSKYPGMGGKGKVPGKAVIAYLPASRKVKVSRKYPSGAVAVVAR